MKKILFLSFILCISCNESTKLKTGIWTGSLTPMNHPEMSNPIEYKVAYDNAELVIHIIASGSSQIQAKNVSLANDTLYFKFDEPEEQVLLSCALAENSATNGFSGRCADPSGKWAKFTMLPPE